MVFLCILSYCNIKSRINMPLTIHAGFLFSFPGAIYVELQNKMDTSISVISWIYSCLSIGFIISNIISGYIADHMIEIHRLHAFMIFITSICIICVPLIDNLIIMFTIFIIIGIGFGINSLSYCLFIFRLYPICMEGKCFFGLLFWYN